MWACEWPLQDHLQISGAPLLDLTGNEAGPSGANNDEAGPSGWGSGDTVKEEDFDVFNDR